MLRAVTRIPQVSVVMPAFNVAPYVLEAVESVLTQSFEDLELIVVDDGSSDGTVERLWGVTDSRLRVIQQANAGSPAARNTGIAQAAAEYVAFIDADDVWSRDKLEAHIRFLERHSEIDLTFSRSELVDESGHSTGRTSARVSGEISFQELLKENVVNNGSAVVMRRKALDLAGWFDAGLRACVDWDLWLRVALLRPHNVFCVDGLLTKYRLRPGQITKNWRRMETEWHKVFIKMRDRAGERVDLVAKEACARLYRYLGYIAYENGEFRESYELLRRAVRFSATTVVLDRRAWVLAAALLTRGILPARLHDSCDAWARRLRSRRQVGVYVGR
jgi:glycosyltransferase involved in cell wall biosynthesis